jgi:hypothetical protein
MLIAIAVLHAGRARSKRVLDVRLRQRVVFVSTVTALVLFLVSTPWPFLPYGRPLLRTSSGDQLVTLAELSAPMRYTR